MKFQDLSEDDIRSIFSFCDIYAVVSMSRTNRYFRRLSLDKLVWVDLVENIRRKGFVDQLSLSDILSYSQEALVALVKSLLTGPASWNPPIEPKRKWFRSTNSLPTQTLAEISAKYSEAKLLNGGEYVLFNNTTLECWSIRRDKLIWAYDKNGLEWSVCEFAAEVVDGGDSVNIIVCEILWTISRDDQSLAHIVNLDLKTGSSTGLLRIECPDKNITSSVPHDSHSGPRPFSREQRLRGPGNQCH
ncbi:hypothetical protein B0H13DRAFT_1993021 [Mycena leptocephala]|nr:hypothetical protein B0H13DRAFT_1993021 [Mycena leptocephala]